MDFPNSVIPDLLQPSSLLSDPLPTLPNAGGGILDIIQGPTTFTSGNTPYDPIASMDLTPDRPSSTALAAPLGFDPVRTRLDRYTNSDYFGQLGFNPLEGYGNEYKYGSVQTWGDVMANAFGGAWKLAGNTFIEGWKGWGKLADAVSTWDSSKLIGTPEELLEQSKFQEEIMNKYAIFSTPESDAGAIWNRKFFGDMVQQSGFALGAIAQFLSEELLTLGLSTEFSLAKLGLRAPSWLGRTVTKAEVLADMARQGENLWKSRTFVDNLVTGAKKFIPLAGTVDDIVKYSRAGAGTLQLAAIGAGGARRFLAESNMAFTEARMEAASTYGELYNNLFDEELFRTGQQPSAEKINRMQNVALDAAYDNFAVNSGILLLSNRLQFDNLFTKFSYGRKVLGEAAGYADDVLTVSGKELTKQYVKGRLGTVGLIGEIAEDFGTRRAAWEASKSLGRNIFKWETSEGLQELAQELSNSTLQKYYYDLYHGVQGGGSITDSMKTAARQMGVNNQGLKTFLMGAMTGRILSPINAAIGQAKLYASTSAEQREQRRADIQENVDLINAFYQNPNKFLNEHIANVKVQDRVAKTMDEAVANRDQYSFQNAKDSGFARTVSAAIKTDMFEPLLNTITGYAETLDPEQFKQAFGMEATEQNIASVKDFFTSVAESTKNFHTTWRNLKDKYSELVIPELYKEGTPERKVALVAKKALDDAIEMMATLDHKSKKALQRANQLQQEVGQVPNVGASAEIAFRTLSNIAAAENEADLLEQEIASLEATDQKDTKSKQLLKEKKKQLEALKGWIENYEKLDSNRNDIRKQFKKTAFNKAFREYVNSKNREGKLTDVKVMASDFNEIYEKFVDFMQLNRDYADYIDAYNIISNPTQFIMMHDRLVDAITSAGEKMNAEHIQEARIVGDPENNEGTLAGLLETATDDDAAAADLEIEEEETRELNVEAFENELTQAYRNYVQEQRGEGAAPVNPSNFLRFSTEAAKVLAKHGVGKNKVYSIPQGVTADKYEEVEFKYGTAPEVITKTTDEESLGKPGEVNDAERAAEMSAVSGTAADPNAGMQVGSYTLNLGDKIVDGVNPEIQVIGFSGADMVTVVTQNQTVDVPKSKILEVLNNGYAKLVKNPNKGQLPATEINRRDLTANPRKKLDNGFINNVSQLRGSTLNQSNSKDGLDKQISDKNSNVQIRKKVVNGYMKVNNRLEDFETVTDPKTGKTKITLTGINEEYPMILATPVINSGSSLMVRVDTDMQDFDEYDYINSAATTKKTKDDYFDAKGKIKSSAVGDFPVAIYSVVNGKEVKLGYLPTERWVAQKFNNGEPMHVVETITVDGDTIDNYELNLEQIALVRKQIMDDFNKRGIVEKGAVVSQKSDGVLRTESGLRKLSEVFHPDTKLAIIKNGIPYVAADIALNEPEENLIMPDQLSDRLGAKDNLEGWPMVIITTPTGRKLVSWISVPTLRPEHQDFILDSWKAFHRLNTLNKSGTAYTKSSEEYKIVDAVYQTYGLKLEDTEAPDFKILQDYLNDYVTYTSPMKYDPLKSGSSQITVLPDGTLIAWAVETGKEADDKLLIKTPAQLSQDNQDKFYKLAALVYYNVKFDGKLNYGINSANKIPFLSVVGGKLVKSAPMTYNEHLFNILETNLAPGIPVDPSKDNSELIHFSNPVINFEFTGVDKRQQATKTKTAAPVEEEVKPAAPAEVVADQELEQAKADIEAKKADIEKRREDKIKKIKRAAKLPGGKAPTEMWNKMIDKINAKYDAELAALEGVKPAEPKPKVTKIISGGQTGADRLGLEIGKELGIQTGGVAPKGYKTEKGSDPSLKDFGLTEDTSSSYNPRTEQNVKTSDGTVIFGDVTSAGSKLTINLLEKNNKPYIVNPTQEELVNFLNTNNIQVLNVAGNRGSKMSVEQIESYKETLRRALSPQATEEAKAAVVQPNTSPLAQAAGTARTEPVTTSTESAKSLEDMLLGADFGEGLTDFGSFDPDLLDDFEGNKKSIATKIETLRKDNKIRKDC